MKINEYMLTIGKKGLHLVRDSKTMLSWLPRATMKLGDRNAGT